MRERVIEDPEVVQATGRPVAVSRGSSGWVDAVNLVLRVIGVVASCVPLVWGLVAIARINWSANGFNAVPVDVGHILFTPWVAIATAVFGLIGVAAAASAFRSPKLVVGAIAACVGLVIWIAKPTVDHIVLGHRFGFMIFVVGVVLALTGILLRPYRETRRVAPATSEYVA
jgi:hypothetical protein